ncbi:putative oxidoreductase [Lachancea thermotolerans CBS 6340]|uniref:KLTH0F01694p n=1 Tax=Lachancea thermotolerans (strain ATCC 56472 / CBS 6340 / NRRL Y-8284) TaxID=559295 RepID=C5DK46_LACTC|nr:KLTH0F01694p [Lachancea thermotolerans CBS 6340]CAR23847.1 KLTH0F01694p [Lachancea thermotolerans CBS 6340]
MLLRWAPNLLLGAFALADTKLYELGISKGVSKEGKQVISLNGKNDTVGPIIRVNSGDTLNLLVNNDICNANDYEQYGELYCDTSIHFHGVVLNNNGADLGVLHDGVPGVSQYSIPSGMSYWYNFTIPENLCGTYWYHSHSSVQYGDGLRGIFLVDCDYRQKYIERVIAKLEADGTDGTLLENLPPQGAKVPVQEVVMAVTDWYSKSSVEILSQVMSPYGGPDPSVEGSMMNGDTGSVKFEVAEGVEYVALRVINTGMSGTNVLHVEGHRLCVIETDGVLTKPYMIDTLSIAVGQRFTVLVKLNKEAPARVVHGCGKMMGYVTKTHWLLRPGQVAGDDYVGRVVHLPGLDKNEMYKQFVPLEGELLPEPSQQLSLDYEFDGDEAREPFGTTMYTVNGDTMQEFMPDGVLIEGARGVREPIPLHGGGVVEIAINSIDHMTHPWHMHGHTFQVVSVGRKRDGPLYFDNPESPAMKRYLADVAEWQDKVPMTRDTINIPGRSYAVIRLRADNPGFWLLHCHVEWHMAKGLGVVFAEGDALVSAVSKPFARQSDAAGASTALPEPSSTADAAATPTVSAVRAISTAADAPASSAAPATSQQQPSPEAAMPAASASKGKVLAIYLLIMCTLNVAIWLFFFR